MALTEFQRTLRKNVIESLKMIASREEQLEYQRSVPIAYVSAELFCMWSDAYHEDFIEKKYFRSAFSESELKAMAEFNLVFERVARSFADGDLPTISDFVLTPEWVELSNAASVASRSFGKAES